MRSNTTKIYIIINLFKLKHKNISQNILFLTYIEKIGVKKS
jgi:hypothetical protein